MPELYKKLTSTPMPEMYSKAEDHPSQAEINETLGEAHRPLLSYDDLPDKDKDKPSIDSIAYLPNIRYLEAVGATQKPGDRKLGAQDEHEGSYH